MPARLKKIAEQEALTQAPDFWNDQIGEFPPDIRDRTFMVELGLRNDPNNENRHPYSFELVFSGVACCIPKRVGTSSAEKLIYQYSLAILFGAMREQFLSITSRMRHGGRLLPTASFLDEDISAPTKILPQDTTHGKELPAPKNVRRRIKANDSN